MSVTNHKKTMSLSFSELQARHESIAKLSRSELEAMNNKELRKIAVGVVLKGSYMPKAELIDKLIEATQDIRDRIQAETEAADRPIDPKEVAKYNRSIDGDKSLAERIEATYQTIRTATLEAVDLDALKMAVSGEALRFFGYESAHYVPTTIKSNASTLKQTLLEMAENEPNFMLKTSVTDAVNLFNSLYTSALRDIIAQQNAAYKAKVAERQHDLQGIKVSTLLNSARLAIAAPDQYHWTQVSVALALLTGRRMAEIHCTAEFTPVDDNHIEFAGQAKTKGREGADQPYIIPTLGDANQIRDAVDYLASIDRRYARKEEVNAKAGKALARAMEKINSVSGLNYKDLRAIYAECAARQFWNDREQTKNAFFASILGHGAGDIETANSYQKFAVDMDV